MTDKVRDPVPMTLGDAGKFKGLVAAIEGLIADGRQDPGAVLRPNFTRLKIRLLFGGNEGDALSKDFTVEELRHQPVAVLAKELVTEYRKEILRRHK